MQEEEDKSLNRQQKRIIWTFLAVHEGPSSTAELKKKKKISVATKIAVNQEEQSVDHTLRGNKRGADYLQSLLSGKLMLNQFGKMHLSRQAGASRGNLWSLLKMCFVGFLPSALSVCYPICHRGVPLQANTAKSSIKENRWTVNITDFDTLEHSLKCAGLKLAPQLLT